MSADLAPIKPLDGKFIFEMDKHVLVRFNADGWVEELSRGGEEEPNGIRLQGKPGSRLDDMFARRFYDLYARVVIYDIRAKRVSDHGPAAGLIRFADLEVDSPLYTRVNKIIEIGNRNFSMSLKPLA